MSACLLWLTGLSGAGKTTLAQGLVARLQERGAKVIHIDGDQLRKGLCSDLGFTELDRRENLRRAGEVARLLVDSGITVVASFISPYCLDRDRIRARFTPGTFAEIFVRCPLETCEHRDPKGLYAKARSGKLKSFTGVSDPYEVPENPELVLDTDLAGIESCVDRLEGMVLKLIGNEIASPSRSCSP
jgi:adenylyl-sulfate kinase